MSTERVAEEVVSVAKAVVAPTEEFLKELVGKGLDAAKKLVRDAGFGLREAKPGDMLSMDFVEDRITLFVKDGTVDKADVG